LEVTPAIDSPEANDALQNVIRAMQDLAKELDEVQSNNNQARDRLEKTWLLREMISLPNVCCFPLRAHAIQFISFRFSG
jgi:hypothetical protein